LFESYVPFLLGRGLIMISVGSVLPFCFAKNSACQEGKKLGEYILSLLLLLLLLSFGPLIDDSPIQKKTSSTMNVTLQMIHLFIDDSPIPKKITKTTVMAQLWHSYGFL
jgi:hypothetical protein